MTRPGVPHPEMPNITWPRRRLTRTPSQGAPLDALLDALLDAGPTEGPDVDGWAPVAALLAAAAAPGQDAELAVEPAAVAAFRAQAAPGVSNRHPRIRIWRPAMLSTLLTAKAAAACAAGAVGLTAAAFTGALPASVQQVAHHAIGAPSAHRHAKTPGGPHEAGATKRQGGPVRPRPTASTAPSPHPTGPDATGHAAFGLCTAWQASWAHGHAKNPKSPAFQALAKAAGGTAKIPAYCATVLKPGHAPSHGKANLGNQGNNRHGSGKANNGHQGRNPNQGHNNPQ